MNKLGMFIVVAIMIFAIVVLIMFYYSIASSDLPLWLKMWLIMKG